MHIITSLNRGGRERQLATIVDTTNHVEYPTKIVYFNNDQDSYISEYRLKDYAIQVEAKGIMFRLLQLNRVLKREKPDIVYTWGNGESMSILLLNPFHRFKFINGSIRHGIRLRKISHYLRSIILHISPRIVANSYSGLKANNLRRGEVLYNGVDTKFIGKLAEVEKKKKRIRLLGMASEAPLLISVANLVPFKDYFSIIRALKLLKDKGYQFQYIILGDGPLRKDIEDTIRQYELSKNIKLQGGVENVNDYLKVADVFIHSSKGEGCSNAILEAMAAGLPVIASDTGGTSEIVSEKCGFLFQYKDVSDLSRLIAKCLSDKALCQKLGIEALSVVQTKFAVEEMMKSYYRIIDELR